MLSLILSGIVLAYAPTATEQTTPQSVIVLNRGVGGATTRYGLARFAKDVERAKPDHLIICYGINDSANSARLVPLAEFSQNLQTMVDRARAVGTESIVLVTMNPIVAEYWRIRHPNHPRKDDIDAYMAEYDRTIREVAKKNGLPIADLRKMVQARGGATTAGSSLIRNQSNSKSKDGVHLREDGYRLMAELFAPIIGPKLKPGDLVVCLGDSLTFGSHMIGQGTSRGRTYPAWLQILLDEMVQTTNRDAPLDPQ